MSLEKDCPGQIKKLLLLEHESDSIRPKIEIYLLIESRKLSNFDTAVKALEANDTTIADTYSMMNKRKESPKNTLEEKFLGYSVNQNLKELEIREKNRNNHKF